MKNVKAILASIAFVGAIGSAYATKSVAQRDLYTKTDGSCDLISCSQIDRSAGNCTNSHVKYMDAGCLTQFTGTAYAVANP